MGSNRPAKNSIPLIVSSEATRGWNPSPIARGSRCGRWRPGRRFSIPGGEELRIWGGGFTQRGRCRSASGRRPSVLQGVFHGCMVAADGGAVRRSPRHASSTRSEDAPTLHTLLVLLPGPGVTPVGGKCGQWRGSAPGETLGRWWRPRCWRHHGRSFRTMLRYNCPLPCPACLEWKPEKLQLGRRWCSGIVPF
jgi:hypothetical protein